MRKMLQSLVTVRHIEPTETGPADPVAAQAMADAILALGACVRPLVVRPSRFDAATLTQLYEVVGDHAAYWAAVLARDTEPVAHEMVSAWIVQDEAQAAHALAQLAA